MTATMETVALRGVGPGGPEHWQGPERKWLTLTDAQAAGIPLDYVADGIGPRVRGMVYRGGYGGTVNTVHDVFVCVQDGRAVWWEVAEESAEDHGRVRRHCTSWTFERRNTPLFMLDTSGS